MKFLRHAQAALLSFVFFAMFPADCLAGMDASFEKEFDRIQEIRRRVEALPAYRETEELKREIAELQYRLQQLAFHPLMPGSPPPSNSIEMEELKRRISSLENRLSVTSKMVANFREAIGGGRSGRLFPDVLHRLAVFTFDDPHGTELGDAISFLLSKKLLFSAPAYSFAIVNYNERLGQNITTDITARDRTTYFDKVDAVTNDQSFLLAVWGRLSRTEGGIRIDSFLQVPADANQAKYRSAIPLPKAMGGGSLIARLTSDRVPIQSIEIDAAAAEGLKVAAREVSKLRDRPDVSAPVIGRLDGIYQMVSSNRDWVQLELSDGRRGWTSVEQFCTGSCVALLKIADFTNGVIALTSGSLPQPLPSGLTRDAAAMSQQLAAVVALPENPGRAVEIAETWIKDHKGASPGFENVLAVAKLRAELVRASAGNANFDEIRLSKPVVEHLIEPLVEASIADPSDGVILTNLVPLFDYVGDARRRDLARQIISTLTP
jgi:hypothetical protein